MYKIKKFVENLFYLYSIQFLNLTFPLVLFPYINRSIGNYNFGVYIYIITFASYFDILIDYGFTLSGTNRVAMLTKLEDSVKIFTNIFSAKIVLWLISCISIFGYSIVTDTSETEKILYWSCSLYLLGNFLTPIWFFQGISNAKFIAVVNLISKITFGLIIFWKIKSHSDIILLMLYNGISLTIGGIIGFVLALKKLNYPLLIFNIEGTYGELKENFLLFISRFGVVLYTTINYLIFKSTVGEFNLIGEYGIAEKVVQVYFSFCSTIIIAVFPFFSKLANQKRIFLKYFFLFAAILFFISISFCAIIFVNAEYITILINNQPNKNITSCIKILSMDILYPFGALLTQYYVIKNYNKELTYCIIFVGIVNIMTAIPVITLYSIIGMSYVTLFMHSLIVILLLFQAFLKHKKN